LQRANPFSTNFVFHHSTSRWLIHQLVGTEKKTGKDS
jgi:hypothetical protein